MSSSLQAQRRLSQVWATGLIAGSFLAFIYLLTYSGAPHNPDDWYFLDGAQAFLNGDLADLQHHGWLFSVLEAPFLAISALIPGLGAFQFASLLNTITTAMTAALIVVFLDDLRIKRSLSVLTAMVYGLGTLAWPYSHYLFREPTAAFFLLLTFWLFWQFYHKKSIGALLLGVIILIATLQIKKTIVAFAPFFFALIVWRILDVVIHSHRFTWPAMTGVWRRMRVLSPFQRVLLFSSAAVALFAAIFGAAFVAPSFIPHYLRHGPNLSAFLALLVSPGWGLLLYAPVLWVAILGIPDFSREYGGLAFVVTGGVLFYILAATTNPFWWGYWSYGPRQLLPLIPLMMLSFPWGWQRLRQWRGGKFIAFLLIGASVIIQLIGVFSPFNEYIRTVLLPQNLTGPGIAWNMQQWPVKGLLHSLTPAHIDIAWLRAGDGVHIAMQWSAILPIVVGIIVTFWMLWQIVRHNPAGVLRRHPLMMAALLWGMWFLVATLAVHTVYADDRYRADMGYMSAANKIKSHSKDGDVVIADLWTEELNAPTVALINYCQGSCPKRIDLIRENLTTREENWQTAHMADLNHAQRVWLVLTRVPEGDPNSIVERWLNDVGYLESCEWTGPQVRLCLYTLPSSDVLMTLQEPIRFDTHIQLVAANVQRTPAGSQNQVVPGDSLQISLRWQTDAPLTQDLMLSTQLLGPDGRLVRAIDAKPGNGFRPTTSWQPGEVISDHRSLTIPEDARPGQYTLLVILYDAASGQRLPVYLPDGKKADAFPLFTFSVDSPSTSHNFCLRRPT